MKRWPLVITLMLGMLGMSGCWDRYEVNDIAIVLAMGIDKEPGGLYRLSLQVPLVSKMGGPSGGGGGTSGGKSYYVDSAAGQTLRDAHAKIQSRMSRHIYYAHHRVVVIGEQLAREGFGESLDIVARFPENRLTSYIVMTRGRAVSLLEAQPQFERFSGEAIRELVKTVTIPVTLKDISQMLSTPGVDAFLPIFEAVYSQPKGKSKEIAATGIGIFRGDKLLGVYSQQESMGLRWFQQKFDPFPMVLDLGKGQKLSVFVQSGKADIRPVLRKDSIHYYIRANTNVRVVENLSNYELEKTKTYTLIETKLAKQSADNIAKILEKTKKVRTDPIGLGIVLARNYPIEWKTKYRDKWNEELPRITYSIESHVQISNVGHTTENITREDPG